MEYEWDLEKARLNYKKHGQRFADATAVFEDDHALTMRDVLAEEEERWITLGKDAFGILLVVVYVWREERIRLISARRATSRERSQYGEQHEK